MKILVCFGALIAMASMTACAHLKTETVTEGEAARLDRKLVKEAVVFEPGTKEGAVVPDLSAPRLRAMLVPEHVENGRLIERHREWQVEGEVSILSIPATPTAKGGHP